MEHKIDILKKANFAFLFHFSLKQHEDQITECTFSLWTLSLSMYYIQLRLCYGQHYPKSVWFVEERCDITFLSKLPYNLRHVDDNCEKNPSHSYIE